MDIVLKYYQKHNENGLHQRILPYICIVHYHHILPQAYNYMLKLWYLQFYKDWKWKCFKKMCLCTFAIRKTIWWWCTFITFVSIIIVFAITFSIIITNVFIVFGASFVTFAFIFEMEYEVVLAIWIWPNPFL